MKVFLSSTTVDLTAHRRVADDTLLRLQLQSVAMERFGPLPGRPVEACKRLAAACDLLVCIVAHRWGYEPEAGRGSITRREVEAARRAGREVLVWMVDERHPWSEPTEQDRLKDPAVLGDPERTQAVLAAIEALADFKAWLEREYVVERFTTPEDLGRKIAIALRGHASGAAGRAQPPPA